MALNVPIHPLCVHLRVKIAGGEGFALLLELSKLEREEARGDGQHKHRQQHRPSRAICRKYTEHHADHKAAHRRAPDERDGVQEANNAAAEGAEHSPAPLDDLPAQAQELVDNRSLPQSAHLDARTECHPRGKDEHRQRKAHRQQQHIVGRGIEAHIGVDLLHRHAQQRNDRAVNEEIEVEGDLFLPAALQLAVLAPRRRAGEEDEQEQLHRAKEDEHLQDVLPPVFCLVVKNLCPVDIILRGKALHKVDIKGLVNINGAVAEGITVADVAELHLVLLVRHTEANVAVAVSLGVDLVELIVSAFHGDIVVADLPRLFADRIQAEVARVKVPTHTAVGVDKPHNIGEDHRHERRRQQKSDRLCPEIAYPRSLHFLSSILYPSPHTTFR